MQDDRYYRNDMDYDYYSHRGNRRKSLDRYAMRPGQWIELYTLEIEHLDYGCVLWVFRSNPFWRHLTGIRTIFSTHSILEECL